MSVSDASKQQPNVSDADKQKLETLRLAYVKAQQSGSAELEPAREAYQDFATQLLIGLSGKLDIPPGPDPGSDDGYVKPGGWHANPDPKTWKTTSMKDNPAKFKVVDDKGVNVATGFKTQAGAQKYIDNAKGSGQKCPAGQHVEPASGNCVPDTKPPAGDKDEFGVLKIYPDKAGGGETQTKFLYEEKERHYASGKQSEWSCEYTAMSSTIEHNSDVEFTCYEKINGFKTNEPDTISDKLTGPPHQDGAKSWVIAEFMTDGSAKATYETEYPHPTYQKIDPKPATSIGGSIIGQWFGHKNITYVKGGERYCESWIHFPVKDINNVGAEQNGWRQYVKPFKVDKKFVKANGRLTTSRLDGIKKGSAPDFKYTSVREITPPT